MTTEIPEKILAEWRAPEFRARGKSTDWFFGAGLVAVALLAWALWTLNIMFLLVVIVGTTTLFLFSFRKPKTYHFKITRRGIWIGKEFHPFQTFDSFWIFTLPDGHRLSLKPNARFSSSIHIVLPEKAMPAVRTTLLELLPEVEEHYSFVDWLADWLRF